MASGSIISWQIEGEKVETVTDFIFLGFKVTADGEIKRCFLLEKKPMPNWDNILKSRDIILPTMVCVVKAMAFPVIMYGCESWVIKNAEHQRIDAFEQWCWRRLLTVLGLQRDQISQSKRKSTLNIYWKDCCWSWKSKILTTWWKMTPWKRPCCWEGLKTKQGGGRGWNGYLSSPIQWTWIWATLAHSEDKEAWYTTVHRVPKSQTQLNDQTTTPNTSHEFSLDRAQS